MTALWLKAREHGPPKVPHHLPSLTARGGAVNVRPVLRAYREVPAAVSILDHSVSHKRDGSAAMALLRCWKFQLQPWMIGSPPGRLLAAFRETLTVFGEHDLAIRLLLMPRRREGPAIACQE